MWWPIILQTPTDRPLATNAERTNWKQGSRCCKQGFMLEFEKLRWISCELSELGPMIENSRHTKTEDQENCDALKVGPPIVDTLLWMTWIMSFSFKYLSGLQQRATADIESSCWMSAFFMHLDHTHANVNIPPSLLIQTVSLTRHVQSKTRFLRIKTSHSPSPFIDTVSSGIWTTKPHGVSEVPLNNMIVVNIA